MQLATDPSNHAIRFAAISQTALGTSGARLDDLAWFYRRLPQLGVSEVFHLGRVSAEGQTTELFYPRVEGVTTLEPQDTQDATRERRTDAESAPAWVTCPSRIPLACGPRRAAAELILVYDSDSFKSLAKVAREVAREYPPAAGIVSRVVLVGGRRTLETHYLDHDRSFIGSVGMFNTAPRNSHRYGGSIVEIQLRDDGALDSATITFRDFSDSSD